MNKAVKQTVHEAIDGFFSAPTSEPLVIEKVGDGVLLSRGIPSSRMTIKAAHSFLGMSYNTFRKRYLDTRRAHVGTDGKIDRKVVLRLYRELDGRD